MSFHNRQSQKLPPYEASVFVFDLKRACATAGTEPKSSHFHYALLAYLIFNNVVSTLSIALDAVSQG